MKDNNEKIIVPSSSTEVPVPDLTDMEEVRKAVIAGEILNRKY